MHLPVFIALLAMLFQVNSASAFTLTLDQDDRTITGRTGTFLPSSSGAYWDEHTDDGYTFGQQTSEGPAQVNNSTYAFSASGGASFSLDCDNYSGYCDGNGAHESIYDITFTVSDTAVLSLSGMLNNVYRQDETSGARVLLYDGENDSYSNRIFSHYSDSNANSISESVLLEAGTYRLVATATVEKYGYYNTTSIDTDAYFDLNGTVSAYVPIPGAAWLFGSALAGLGWSRRRLAV